MMGGLIAATILTLTFLPALYALAFRVVAPSRGAQSKDAANLEAKTEPALPAAA
jgi:multidrug efflux pump